ncbi:MAG TPA: N-glycosylase/DNA lyase [Exilispira sp.]|nr:N-glycosylase/DNA lyase [Exilispira sp.]
MINEEYFNEIINIYKDIKDKIEKRLKEFKDLWNRGNHEELLNELIFCILTPQSKAKVCHQALLNFKNSNYNSDDILNCLKGVRFKYKKSDYIKNILKIFNEKGSLKNKIQSFNSIFDLREWLVKNIKGLGYKEASHFLRNIGFGENLAILDRHILKNLYRIGIIENIPSSLSKKSYLDIENRMRVFAKEINIPLEHLDFVLWYKETGEVFK